MFGSPWMGKSRRFGSASNALVAAFFAAVLGLIVAIMPTQSHACPNEGGAAAQKLSLGQLAALDQTVSVVLVSASPAYLPHDNEGCCGNELRHGKTSCVGMTGSSCCVAALPSMLMENWPQAAVSIDAPAARSDVTSNTPDTVFRPPRFFI